MASRGMWMTWNAQEVCVGLRDDLHVLAGVYVHVSDLVTRLVQMA